jgi:hypothetical protein
VSAGQARASTVGGSPITVVPRPRDERTCTVPPRTASRPDRDHQPFPQAELDGERDDLLLRPIVGVPFEPSAFRAFAGRSENADSTSYGLACSP